MILILSFICLSHAYAYEDTAEFLYDASEADSQQETWSYIFELMDVKGESTNISSVEPHTLLKPASTMKVFTAWWAMVSSFRTDTFLAEMLKKSVNQMADETAQGLGGVLAMEDFYREKGLQITDETFQAADGSGLSYSNKTTCQVQIELLKLIRRHKDYERFKNLMAQPGQLGTLQNRLSTFKGRLFAKTGTLKRTASLSGFLETAKGTVVFCVLSDYLSITVAEARIKIDQLLKKHDQLVLKP